MRSLNPEIDFRAETREYFHKGVRVPSVTEIVKEAGVADFSRIPPAVLEKAAARGRKAHMVAEAIDLNLFDDKNADEADIETAKDWRSAKEVIFKASHPIDELIEQIIYCEKPQYAGRFDRAWELPGKRLLLADIKTGGFNEKYCGLQLAGYAGALRVAFPDYLIQSLVIQLKDGFKIIPVPWADYTTYFISAYNIYQLKKR